MKTTLILAVVAIVALAGCASHTADPNYTAYLAAVNAQQAAQATQVQKPLIDIKCLPNVPCSFASVTVYAPPSGDQHGPVIAMPQAQPDAWANVASTLINVAGTVAGYGYGAKAAIGIGNAIKDSGTAGYKYVQAPAAAGAVTNTSIVQDSGNTTSTTTTTTNSNNPVTTATDNHAVTTNPTVPK